MVGVLSFLWLLSAGAFILAIVFLLVRIVKKQRKKPFVIMASSTFILSFVLMMLVGLLYEPSEKSVSTLSQNTVTDQPEPETSVNADKSALESETDTDIKQTATETENTDRQVEQEKDEKEQEEKEAKEKAEQEAKQKAEREAEEKEKAELERAEKEKAEREKAEKEAKEKAAREKAEKEKQEKSKKKETKKASRLKFDGELITDATVSFMKEYDYIRDVYIDVIEDEKKINIAVQVPSATDLDVAEMAGEDTARYLASLAAYANDYYEVPGVDSIGSLYDRYSLLIYIDDGYGNFDIYGAKVPTARDITW